MKEFDNFIVKDNCIIIKDHVKNYRPITGITIAGITGDDPFQTSFSVFMKLFRLTSDKETSFAMEKGQQGKNPIINYINQTHNTDFQEYSTNEFYDFDVEKELGNKLNGKLPGWDPKQKIVIKTIVTKNKWWAEKDKIPRSKKEWWTIKNPPQCYLIQLSLYAYLANAKEIWLGAYFVENKTYANDILFVDNEQLVVWKIKFNQEIKKKFNSKLKVVNKFIKDHLEKRISPSFDIAKKCDQEILEKLGIEF